jgi:hypothetical protein
MRAFVLRNQADDAAGMWAHYGATQALEMIGLSWREVAESEIRTFEDLTECTVLIGPCARGLGKETWAAIKQWVSVGGCALFSGGLPEWFGETDLQFLGIEPASVAKETRPAGPPQLLHVEDRCVFGVAEEGPVTILSDVDLPTLGPSPLAGMRCATAAPLGKLLDAASDNLKGDLIALKSFIGGGVAVTFGSRIFETIGLLLSRYSWDQCHMPRESFARQVDELWDNQLSSRWGRVPVTAEYVEILENILRWCHESRRLPFATRWAHPCRDGEIKMLGLIVSHDTDAAYESGAKKVVPNRWFNFPRWMELETSLGTKSAFYLIADLHDHKYPMGTGNYEISDPPVREAAATLASKGWEVSIHQTAHDALDLLRREKERFEKELGLSLTGTRSHHLKNVPDTLKFKEAIGLAYDSTWYFEGPGSSFLTGALLPYRPLDPKSGQAMEILEFAFVVEDGNVFGYYTPNPPTGYRDEDGAVADGRIIIEMASEHAGYVCFNWHQRTFALMGGKSDSWTGAFVRLFKAAKEKGRVWTSLPVALARWWNRRQKVEIEIAVDAQRQQTIRVTNHGEEAMEDFVLAVSTSPALAPKALLLDGKRLGLSAIRTFKNAVVCGVHLPLKAGERRELKVEYEV